MPSDRLDNTPNARKLLDSLRYLGYDNLYAISDLVDNAVDADAQHVNVTIERTSTGDFTIRVADDGVGMTESVLDQAARLGSQAARNPATDLGRFGMGLVTASLSLGRRLTIITKTADGELLSNITDVDHMTRTNAFLKEYFGKVREHERELFRQLLGEAEHGTIVEITKADGFKRKYVGAFEKTLAEHIGRVYRMFIRSGRAFYVNSSDPVPVKDPLWLDDDKTEVYSDETYELKHTDDQGQSFTDPVRVRLVILPDHGNSELNRKAGYRVERSGFYVLRNNREIAEAQLLGLSVLSRHPDFIRFRGEVFVTGRMDEAMGIEFTKRDVKPIQSIRDQIEVMVGGNIKSLRAQLKRKTLKSDSETPDHSASERLIDSKSGLLIKPVAQRSTTQADGATTTQDDTSVTRLGVVRFRNASFGREGPIYAAEQRGKTTFVDWNTDHPFYERFVFANRSDKDAASAIDSLIFSMAAAELKVFDDDHRSFIESWKTIFSSNLRTLLS